METLKLAIQKSGRLSDDSIRLLEACGISFEKERNKLKVSASNYALEILFLRNSDIPICIQNNIADVGIIGQNLLEESDVDLEVCDQLGFSKCRLSLAIPKGVDYSGIQFFENKTIATSYPNSLEKWLKSKNITAKIQYINGSVEIAPGIGMADAICDIVSTGNTLLANELEEVEQLLFSEAVLVKSRKLNQEKEALLDTLLFRVRSILRSKQNKYILMNLPNDQLVEVGKVLPAMKSPTILPLSKPGWSSVHTVIEEDRFWEVIDELKGVGAEGILIAPIEKMVL